MYTIQFDTMRFLACKIGGWYFGKFWWLIWERSVRRSVRRAARCLLPLEARECVCYKFRALHGVAAVEARPRGDEKAASRPWQHSGEPDNEPGARRAPGPDSFLGFPSPQRRARCTGIQSVLKLLSKKTQSPSSRCWSVMALISSSQRCLGDFRSW
jgi:hypothetical protein